MPEKRKLLFETKIIPKTYDIDIADHVNNIVYVRWLEDLRYYWLDTYFPLNKVTEIGLAPVILDTYIKYIQPVRLYDEVYASIWVSEMKLARYKLEFEFTVDDKVVCSAAQHGAWIDVKTGRPVRAPEGLRDLWVEKD